MRILNRILFAAGIVLVLAALLASCNWPSFGREQGGNTGKSNVPTNTDGAETILIPGGTFWMGSDETDADADEDEMPRHQVTLSSFYIYTHEVTNAMYAKCVSAGGCWPVHVLESGPTTHYNDPAYADHPVVGVTWDMARDYCAWAGARLPTEAEWELAARGTDSLRYPWGSDSPACDRVNMLGCLVPPNTAAVGSYALGNSPYGVWDTSGNVWEWVHDWYAENYYTFSPASNPLGPFTYQDPDHPLKVVRGGGLYSEPRQMRSAARLGANPYRPYDDVGFRCVAAQPLTLPEEYVDAGGRIEMVPPAPLDPGGERVEDPETSWMVSLDWGWTSCPVSGGIIRVVLALRASIPTTFTLSTAGGPCDCTYDEMLRMLVCECPEPDGYDELPVLPVELCFDNELFGDCWEVGLEKPDVCDAEGGVSWMRSRRATCPQDGFFDVTFTHEPPVTWDMISFRAGDLTPPLACVVISEDTITCTAPYIPVGPGGYYEFYLHGFTADRVEFWWEDWLPMTAFDGCPVDFSGEMHSVGSICWEGNLPAVQLNYSPDARLENITVDDAPADCIGMAPGTLICTLRGSPGEARNFEFCFAGGSCYGYILTVADCGVTPVEPIPPVCEMSPVCWGENAPAVGVTCVPPPSSSVHMDSGIILPCEEVGAGRYLCTGLPGAPGDVRTIRFCVGASPCFSEELPVPDCGITSLGNDWQLVAVGCHDESRLYFMVDTGLPWLVPGAEATFVAADGETTYSCSIHPAVAGRVYCAGLRPGSPGALAFCVRQSGDPVPVCQTFAEYPAWVSRVPPCAAEPPSEPPVPRTPTCADYTDQATCDAHWAQGCKWTGTYCSGP